jgi:Calx-beta domain
VSLSSQRVVTATATDSGGNTSEFSMGDTTGLTGNVQFSFGAIELLEDIGLLNVTVLRKGGSTGTLTVDFATEDGTAIGGQDYTSTSGTLAFGDGEISKSFQVQITDDATVESDETFAVLLRNASSPEIFGAPAVLVVNIEDSDSTRTLSLQDIFVSVPEGNAGSTTEMFFTVNLSAPSLRTVRVDFATEKISAIGGASCGNQAADFETALGTIILPPGTTSADISITVCGDLNPELDEIFRLRFVNPVNVTLAGAVAFGTIVDDDVFELLRDESGPADTQVAALDAISLLRDPFRVQGIPEWFPNVPDRNTRVILFVRNLQLDPGELPSSVTVRLLSDLLQSQDVPAVDVRTVPNTDLTQVTFRLPDNLAPGTYLVHVRAHGRSSNTGMIRIAP